MVGSNQSGVITEGCYTGMDFSGNVTLKDGTYIVTGDVTIGAQAKVTCGSCTIILTNSNPLQTGTVTINAGAELNMKSQPTGPYAGILFYQDRGATANQVNKINGNAYSVFQGAFYFPNQEVVFNGTAGLSYECLQLVSRRVTFTGTSAIANNCPADSGAGAKVGRHIRLVA